MWFLAVELWPYILGALCIGVVTGWIGGCGPRGVRTAAPAEEAPR